MENIINKYKQGRIDHLDNLSDPGIAEQQGRFLALGFSLDILTVE
jgi:hypothetical protein